MSNILVITSSYLGAASANGICAKNIVEHLKRNHHNVFVVCHQGEPTEDNVYTFPYSPMASNRTVISKIANRLRAICSPTLDSQTVDAYKTLVLHLCAHQHIDMVISVFFPLETLPVLRNVKSNFPDVKTIIYEVDSVGDGIFSSNKRRFLTAKAYERWNSCHYRYADRIIVMQSHEDYWRKTFGKKFGHKLALADIPVLVEKTLPTVQKEAKAPVSFLYGGLMERAYRSPAHLLSVFATYAKNTPATLDFFSKGDCEDMVARVAEETAGITQHGYVPQDVLDEAVARADVLVSIGNRVSRSVPSKLITYLSYGKPVVHFSSQKEDVCAEYLEKYPLGLVLNEWDTVEKNAQRLTAFVKNACGKTVRFEDVARLLEMNTPAYSAEIIASM